MSYPVTVVIPTIDSRYEFLTKRCLPSVKANDPAEIIVVFGIGNGSKKRNSGARSSTQPFLLFVDDDAELQPDCIQTMVTEMEQNPDVSFVYSGFKTEVVDGVPWSGVRGDFFPGKFDLSRLRQWNYINTTSLIRKSCFPGFDPVLRRLQDWDLWLTMVSKDLRGMYIDKVLFTLNQIDIGVTMSISDDEALDELRKKHGL